MNTFEKGGPATIPTTSAPTASATARERDDRETHRPEVCRRALAAILEANLTHLDALTHGFFPAHIRCGRRPRIITEGAAWMPGSVPGSSAWRA
jgi:hypothetical protein